MSDRKAPDSEQDKEFQTSQPGKLFIMSAPSGTGKTTLCQKILNHFTNIRYSISHTTRFPRPGEQDGIDYFFTSADNFLNGIKNGTWAEWARVHDNYYGTSIEFLDNTLFSGKDILLDIDVQGAMQLIKQYPQAITIFIMPPSMEILRTRIQRRGTDSDAVIEKRLQNAKEEIEKKDFYKHIVVNDKLEDAIEELFQIICQYQKNEKF